MSEQCVCRCGYVGQCEPGEGHAVPGTAGFGEFGGDPPEMCGPMASLETLFQASDELRDLRTRLATAERERDEARTRQSNAEIAQGRAEGKAEIALRMLARCYFAVHREGWEPSETEGEVMDEVCCVLANAISPEWPAGWDWARTLKALERGGGE